MTAKKKNILLLVGFVLMLFTSYQLAFKKTFSLKTDVERLQKEIAMFENTPASIARLEVQQTYYDSILRVNKVTDASEQNSLLQAINAFGNDHDLNVVNFLEPHRFKNEDLTVTTYECSIEGDYNGLIQLLQELENNPRFGDVSHVRFEKKKEPRTRRVYLVVTLLISNFS